MTTCIISNVKCFPIFHLFWASEKCSHNNISWVNVRFCLTASFFFGFDALFGLAFFFCRRTQTINLTNKFSNWLIRSFWLFFSEQIDSVDVSGLKIRKTKEMKNNKIANRLQLSYFRFCFAFNHDNFIRSHFSSSLNAASISMVSGINWLLRGKENDDLIKLFFCHYNF